MEKLSEKELYKLWKKYIDKSVYRVISKEYLKDVKKNGFNPKKDPFSDSIKKKIKKFFKIILRLHKKRIIYKEKIGRNNEFTIYGKYIVERSIISMNSNFIDLTPNYIQALKFKRLFHGGALTMAVYRFCNFLKDKKYLLTTSEKKLLSEMFEWVNKKRNYSTRLVFIKGSHSCLSKAKFHYQLAIRKNQKYLASPYGSFEHFKKILRKNGHKKYFPYLKEKNFYLRVISKIPPSAIIKIK